MTTDLRETYQFAYRTSGRAKAYSQVLKPALRAAVAPLGYRVGRVELRGGDMMVRLDPAPGQHPDVDRVHVDLRRWSAGDVQAHLYTREDATRTRAGARGELGLGGLYAAALTSAWGIDSGTGRNRRPGTLAAMVAEAIEAAAQDAAK